MGKNYTDSTKIQNLLQRELTTEETALLSFLLPTIDTWIDNYTDTTFKPVEASTRYYDSEGGSLDIDPCTEITAVSEVWTDLTVSYAYTPNIEYMAEPLNDTVKTELRHRWSKGFPCGASNIAVTAKFSYYVDGIREDIAMAATLIAADVIREGQRVAAGAVASESLEGHTVTYHKAGTADVVPAVAMQNPTVMQALNAYREVLIG